MAGEWMLVYVSLVGGQSDVRVVKTTEPQCKEFVRFFSRSLAATKGLGFSGTAGFCISPNGDRWHINGSKQ